MISNTVRILMMMLVAVPATAATLGPTQTGYPILELSPSQLTVNVGESFTVDLVIRDFASTSVEGLSAFEIGVGTVPTFISIDGHSLGTELGNPLLGESTDTSAGQISANVYQVGQISNLSPEYLSSQLPGTIVLATLQFTALAPLDDCQCVVINASPQLYDAFGNEFLANVVNEGVNVTIVPLPAAVWLLLAGLACLPMTKTVSSP